MNQLSSDLDQEKTEDAATTQTWEAGNGGATQQVDRISCLHFLFQSSFRVVQKRRWMGSNLVRSGRFHWHLLYGTIKKPGGTSAARVLLHLGPRNQRKGREGRLLLLSGARPLRWTMHLLSTPPARHLNIDASVYMHADGAVDGTEGCRSQPVLRSDQRLCFVVCRCTSG